MSDLFQIDWGSLLVPHTPLLEIFVRGTTVYLALFAMLRLVLKREAGSVGLTDLLVLVLIADAAQGAMGGEDHSITAGLLTVLTVVGWAYIVDWAAYRFPRLRRLIRPPALLLVRDGRMLRRNMRRELLTEEELRSQLRLQGVEDPGAVKIAYMESDGRISIVSVEEAASRARDATGGTGRRPEALAAGRPDQP